MEYDELRARFRVWCEEGRYGNNWVVTRRRDGRVMTEGSVVHCLRWIDVWGPMRL